MKIQLPIKRRPRLYLFSMSSPELVAQDYTGANGLYSAVVPDEEAVKHIQAVGKLAGFEPDLTKLHVTVMYSKECCKNPDEAVCESDRIYRGRIQKLQHWEGHDKKGYLTAAISSPELVEEHKRLKSLGCVPTFEYNPHVTIWAGVLMTEALQHKIEEAQQHIDKLPELKFVNQFIGDLKDD